MTYLIQKWYICPKHSSTPLLTLEPKTYSPLVQSRAAWFLSNRGEAIPWNITQTSASSALTIQFTTVGNLRPKPPHGLRVKNERRTPGDNATLQDRATPGLRSSKKAHDVPLFWSLSQQVVIKYSRGLFASGQCPSTAARIKMLKREESEGQAKDRIRS